MAFDVAYQLNDKPLATFEEAKTAEPFKIAITDRIWAAPGVEQTSKDLLPPVKFDSQRPHRIHIVAAEDCRDSGTCLRYPHVGPECLDDVAWPLTRELYGLGRPYDDQEESTFSGPTLQW